MNFNICSLRPPSMIMLSAILDEVDKRLTARKFLLIIQSFGNGNVSIKRGLFVREKRS